MSNKIGKYTSPASSWWAERSKLLATIVKSKPTKRKIKKVSVKKTTKAKRAAKKMPKAKKGMKIKKATKSKKAAKIKKVIKMKVKRAGKKR